MNKIHRIVWSAARNAYIVAHEKVATHGKPSSSRKALMAAGLLAALAVPPAPTFAAPPVNTLPTGGRIVGGAAAGTISTAGSAMTVNQTQQKMIANWDTYNIGQSASVHYQQPTSGVALNRVNGGQPSEIYGKLTATGTVYLLNNAGILFGKTAQVDVGALVASTGKMSDTDFLANKLRIVQEGAGGSVVNEGKLKTAMEGYIALLAPEVRNQGLIFAQKGTVALAAGEAYDLQFDGTRLANVRVEPGTLNALVENGNAVEAPGGLIILSAHAVNHLQGSAIRNNGTLDASSMTIKGGRIVLESSGAIENTGTLKVSGGPGQAAGSIEISAPQVVLNGSLEVQGQQGGQLHAQASETLAVGARIDASGIDLGGNVVLEAARSTQVTGSIAATASEGTGGEITLAAGHDVTVENASLNADSATQGGHIRIKAEPSIASGLLDPANPLNDPTAPGTPTHVALTGGTTFNARSSRGRGGQIDLTGDHLMLGTGTRLVASGKTGGGLVQVGGGWQGSGGLFQATTVTMEHGATIDVSATKVGTGGTAVLWSDVTKDGGVTRVDGEILAKGGAEAGDGGKVETSGHSLNIGANVRINTLAPNGQGGELLLDPTNFTITAGSAAQTTSGIGATTLEGLIAGNANTTITTSADANGSDLGDINIDAPLTWSANKLTLSAHHSVLVNDVVTVTQAGKLDITTNTNTSDDTASLANVGYLKIKQARVNTSVPTDEFVGKITFSDLTYPTTAYPNGDPTSPANKPYYQPLTINGNNYWVITPEFIAKAAIYDNRGSSTTNLNGHFNYWYGNSQFGGYSGVAPFYVALGQDFSGTAAARDNGSGPAWIPISQFKGVFEGLGHTVSSVTVNGQSGDYNITSGIFGKTDGATIRNFGIVNTTINGTYSTDNSTANNDKLGTGGIVGQAISATTLQNVFTSANSKVVLASNNANGYNYYYGGLVGWSNAALTIVDSYNAAPIYSTSTAGVNYTAMNSVGGLVGSFQGTSTSGQSSLNVPLNIYNSYNVAEIRSGTLAATDAQRGNHVGGIIGSMNNGLSASTSSLAQIKNYGDIYGKDSVGGIIGSNSIFKNTTMTKLTNDGDIYSNGQAHGILYLLQTSTDMTLSHTSNTGNITKSSASGNIGGLFSYFSVGSIGNVVVESSYNSGSITAALGAYAIGGLMANTQGNNASGQPTLTFRNVYNTGNIFVGAGANPTTDANKIGGFIGYDDQVKIIFENGYNSGNISYASNTGIPPYVGAIVGAYNNQTNYSWDTFTNIYASGTYTKVATNYNAGTADFSLYGTDITSDPFNNIPSPTNTGASAKTVAELQVPPATLSFPTDKWGQSATINGGLPYLTGFSIPLTITFGALSKIYGDAAYPSLVLDTNYTCSAGCNFAINWNPATFGQYKAAGTYGYTTSNMFSLGSGADAYEITYATTNSYLINPRPINLIPTAGQSKTYGDANPASYTYTPETAGSNRGLVNSDTFTGALARAAGETVGGNYAYDVGTLANSNYSITVVPANFAITTRPITLTATAASKIYGNADPALAVTVTGGSLASVAVTDTLAEVTGTVGRQAGNNVGTYDIALGSGSKASNYAISFTTDNNAFTIDKRTVTLTATKTYDGNANLTGSQVTIGNTASGESLNYAGATAALGKDVATANNHISGIVLADNGVYLANNYQLPTLDNTNAPVTITQKTVALSSTKEYDGTNDMTGKVTITTGVGSETLTYTGASVNDYHVPTANKFVSLTLADASDASGGLAANYQYTNAYNASNNTVSITPKTLTPTFTNATITKEYDRETDAPTGFTPTFSFEGFVTGDIDAVLATTSILYNSEDVPTATSLTLNGLTISGITGNKSSGASDYNLSTDTLSKVASITPKSVSVTGVNIADKEYDGTTNPTSVLSSTFNGVIAPDDVNVSGNLDAFSSKNTGVYSVAISGLTLSGNDKDNYSLTSTSATDDSVAITQKTISVAASKVYDGDANFDPAEVTLVTGVGSETLAYTGTAAANSANVAATDKHLLTGGMTLGNGDGGGLASNYQLPTAAYDAVKNLAAITARPVNVTADDQTKIYGNADPALTYVADTQSGDHGLVDGQSLTGALARIAGENASTTPYSINQGTLTDANNTNYAITYTADGLTITKRPVILTTTTATKIYGDADPVLAVTAGTSGAGVGLATTANGNTVNDTLAEVTGTVGREAGSNVGTYDIQLGAGSKTGNYDITFTADNNAYTITPRPVTVTANARSKTYGDSDPSLTFAANSGTVGSGSGLMSGDSLSGSLTRETGETVLDGPYAIEQGGVTNANNGNYDITYVEANLTINAKTVTLSAGKVYDGTTVLEGYVTIGTGVGSETLTYTGATVNDKNVTTAGKYIDAITLANGTGVASNYDLPELNNANAPVTITAKALTVSGLSSQDKVYDGTTTATINGAAALQASITAGSGSSDDGKAYTGDAVSLSGMAVANFNDKDVADANRVIFTGMSLAGDDADNYTLTPHADHTTPRITPKALTISGLSSQSKVYDGATTATVSGTATWQQAEPITSGTGSSGDSKRYTGDDVNLTGTAVGNFNDKDVVDANRVIFTGLSLTGNEANNYSLTQHADDTEPRITTQALTVSGITAADKVYDGNTTATLNTSGVSLSGLVGGDSFNVSANGTFSDKNIGTGKTVTLTSTYSGADVSNYSVTGQTSTSASISQKALTVSGITATDKVYDGATTATVSTSGASYAGLVGGDNINVSASGSFGDKNAGTDKTVTLVSTYSGGDVGNYTITDQTTTTATISTKTLTVSGITASDKVYDGNATASLNTTGLTYTGLVTGDEFTVAVNGLFSDKNVGSGKAVSLDGAYGGADRDNYSVASLSNITASITPKAISMTGATAEDKTFDGNTSATVGMGSLIGLISGESLGVSGIGRFADSTVGIDKTVNIQLALADTSTGLAGNYTISDTSALANINPVPTSVPPPPPSVPTTPKPPTEVPTPPPAPTPPADTGGSDSPGGGKTTGTGTGGDGGSTGTGTGTGEGGTSSGDGSGGGTTTGSGTGGDGGSTGTGTGTGDGGTTSGDGSGGGTTTGSGTGGDGGSTGTGTGKDTGDGGTTSGDGSGGGTTTGSSDTAETGSNSSSESDPLTVTLSLGGEILLGQADPGAGGSSTKSSSQATGDDGTSGFISVRTFGATTIPVDTLFSFTLPKDTFKHADPKAVVVLEARLADGKPLPSWLQFDPGRGRFTGLAPQGVQEIEVRVVARDSTGGEAATKVVLRFIAASEVN